jgi:hypothetical protein
MQTNLIFWIFNKQREMQKHNAKLPHFIPKSATHGGFDDDGATMANVIRLIRGEVL